MISEGTDDPYIRNLTIYNNTVVAKAGDAPWIGLDFTSQPNGSCDGLYIRNNIVQGFQDAWLKGSNGATNITNAVVTHNDAIGNGSSNTPSWPSGNPTNYTYNNNRTVNPLFVSTTNFALQAVSPLIDAGINVGLPYTGTAPDGGYKEFGTGALPILLVDFTAKESNGSNILNWNTASEINSDHFNIERSTDGRNYYSIGRVNASGFSSTEVKYSFTDVSPADGKNFYRLVMTDRDGSFEYSKIVAVTNRKNQSISFGYVNLSNGTGSANITINSSKMQPANLSIIDATGRIILNTPVHLQAGTNNVIKNIPSISNGVYYVRLFTTDETVVNSTISH
ncbi:MAG: T9SS type A sorting domain-containing protein [Chitinophagaceae bacterium]|nr:T9SS type A sorting domain-containing protein [Chitinophagaceae bacterium]